LIRFGEERRPQKPAHHFPMKRPQDEPPGAVSLYFCGCGKCHIVNPSAALWFSHAQDRSWAGIRSINHDDAIRSQHPLCPGLQLGRHHPELGRNVVLRRSLLCAADGCLGRTVICRTDQAPFFISFWALPQRGCCERTPKSRKGSSDPLKELLRSPKPVAGGSLPPSKARQGNVRRDRSI